MKVSNKAEPVALDASVVSLLSSLCFLRSFVEKASRTNQEEENFLGASQQPRNLIAH